MIGDFFLRMGYRWRQLWCRHDYRQRVSLYGVFTWRECSKCERTIGWMYHR